MYLVNFYAHSQNSILIQGREKHELNTFCSGQRSPTQ